MVRCIDDTEEHLAQSVLSQLTHGVKFHLKQSSLSLADDMEARHFFESFQLNDSGEEPVYIEANDLDALPYKSIKPLVESGQIDLCSMVTKLIMLITWMIGCIDVTEEHLAQSVLSELTHGVKSHLKQSLLSLADNMVPEPQLDQYVFCRSKTFFESFQLNDIGEEPVNIEANDLDALPYKSIKPLVESGQINLEEVFRVKRQGTTPQGPTKGVLEKDPKASPKTARELQMGPTGSRSIHTT
ncbi:hypothetical protein KY285_008279 [Solanum tuberosum]|nr:hypothetical protein KY285_008279 [Solanum tuberosum]